VAQSSLASDDSAEASVGRALFAAVVGARRQGVDAEAALRATVDRFVAAFRAAESSDGSAGDAR
jgi:uncharacterized protein YabN with tetrapyrrole methylase and pyrophosphatase domain